MSTAEQRAAGHEFRATERVPGWCVHCGGAEFVHRHPAWKCRPETCGGIDYDPCEVAVGGHVDDLPGMWEPADFTGGAPDEVRGPDHWTQEPPIE